MLIVVRHLEEQVLCSWKTEMSIEITGIVIVTTFKLVLYCDLYLRAKLVLTS